LGTTPVVPLDVLLTFVPSLRYICANPPFTVQPVAAAPPPPVPVRAVSEAARSVARRRVMRSAASPLG